MRSHADSYLLFEVEGRRCALAIDAVEEVLRPPPTDAVPDAPEFVLGVALVRGRAVPVLDGGAIVSGRRLAHPARMITLRVDSERRAGLLVSRVAGVVARAGFDFEAAPPLLDGGEARVLEALGRRDGALLHLLRLGRVVPEAVWTGLARDRGPS